MEATNSRMGSIKHCGGRYILWEGSRKVNTGIFESQITDNYLPSGEQNDKKVDTREKLKRNGEYKNISGASQQADIQSWKVTGY